MCGLIVVQRVSRLSGSMTAPVSITFIILCIHFLLVLILANTLVSLLLLFFSNEKK